MSRIQNFPIRLARKLKKKHIELPGFKTMSVRLAAQTVSRSVAKGSSMFVQFGTLSEEALVTAEHAEFVDKLFNAFDS